MTDSAPIFIATRGSALALAQAHTVQGLCQAAFPGLCFELRIIKTTGDKLQTASLASSELPKGLFTKEIEEALSRREADLAVHSLKDLPTELPAGLTLGAVLKRADVRDVLVGKLAPAALSDRSAGPVGLSSLPAGATVATSSTRRRAQLLDLRPDLTIVPIRGNVDTRLRKVREQTELHATVLAAAGLKRLGFDIRPDGALVDGRPSDQRPAAAVGDLGLRAAPMEPEEMLPCVGQAAIGIEARGGDALVAPILEMLNDRETFQCVLAERAFLSGMGGGCQLAVAAYAQVQAGTLRLRAVSFLGDRPVRGEATGPSTQGDSIGRRLASQLAPVSL